MKIYHNSIFKILLVLLSLAVTLPSCNDYLDINADPNNPTDINGDYDLALGDITLTTSYNLVGGGNFTRYSALWIKHIAFASEPPSEDTYRVNTSDFNNIWAFDSYAGVLINCKFVIDNGTADEAWNHVAIAKILMAHDYALLSDYFGDIPRSEALQRTANLQPKYDTQEDVYEYVQSLLDEAIVDIDKNSPIAVGDGDHFLGGDMDKWKKVAYALKARYYLRLTKAPGKDAATQAQNALNAIQNAMTSADDEAALLYTGQAAAEGPWNQWVSKFATTVKTSNYFLNLLQSMNDPRLSAFVDKAVNTGTYVGHENGTNDLPNALDDVSSVGEYYLAARIHSPLMTYVEQKFIEAEALLHLGKTGDAATTYADAIKLHMAQLSGEGELGTVISEGDMNAYIAANPMNGLESIITQKYIAGFLWSSSEAFHDYRRTGFPSSLTPAQNGDLNQLPTRIPYPDTEINSNSQNVPPGVTLTSKVWWDQD